MTKLTIFQKIVLLLLALLIPIVLLFRYSNQVSVGVIQREIEASTIGRLVFFVNQLNSRVSQLSSLSVMIGHDATIRQYQTDYLQSEILNLDKLKFKEVVADMLALQSSSAGWTNTIRVYSPSLGEYVGSVGSGEFRPSELQRQLHLDWHERVTKTDAGTNVVFVRHVVEPFFMRNDLEKASTIVEVQFDDDNIRRMLDDFKRQGENDPFLYRAGFELIPNTTSDRELTGELVDLMGDATVGRQGAITVKLDGMKYLVVYEKMEELDWYAMDYTPVQQILTPITKTRNLFYVSAGLLLALTMLAAILLYRNVQLPIRRLIRALQQLKRGDLSARIKERPRNEFGFVFDRFNEMTDEMRTLIDTVYVEKLRSREATLKQLQSQINPHFLYNCLAFITSMAKLKDTDSVVAMALNLGSYYRYATRADIRLVPLTKELEVIENYLAIQSMRNPRIQYELKVPEEMKRYGIPMLTLQPIVENAIIHGLEPKPGIGKIRISGEMTEERLELWVEDNGIGMNTETLALLNRKIRQPVMEDDMGCGMWNVHQRMLHQFGEGTNLVVTALTGGGLRVRLSWPRGVRTDGDEPENNGNGPSEGRETP
ncbi:sensor histidine kinase [Paenibacillus macerans]|uniref:sensor histidine kinase n=1 Tax=Paenibacillus macerans TaxID=44252 RepID=UPI003D3147E4